MTRQTATAILFLGLSSLACLGGDDEAKAPLGPIEVTEPWADMGLPVEEGFVSMSDGRTISVRFTGKTVEELTGMWYQAVERTGFVRTATEIDGRLDDELNHGVFQDAETQLTVSVVQGIEDTLVILTRSARPPPETP